MKNIFQAIIRLFIVTFIEGLSLLLTAWIFAGITITAPEGSSVFVAAMSVAIVLAILNGLVRPLLILLTLPINMITLGLFTLVINALMLMLTSYFLPFFQVDGFWAALGGGLVLAAVNTVLTGLTSIDDDQAFYDGVVQWLSKRKLEKQEEEPGRGLVMLEIDGLSFQRMKKAIESGIMPTAQKWVQDGTHKVSHVDCGLPSQTSACQAGIMYGDNYDIPAFRWFDKEQGRLYVSSNFHDAAEINGRYSDGNGLLRQGTSVNNLMAGDAQKAILTMSVLVEGPEEVDRRSPEDMYLVFVNPYFFVRAFVLTIWDILVEFFQMTRQRLRNVQPRINRLEKAYPILRGVTNVLMRDISGYTVILDIIRGSPAIYTTFVGYDEVAHHAGPDTKDAMDTLRGFDKQLNRILSVVERKAPRPYDIFVLSDHGQSYGATFRQRYGLTLGEYLESLVHSGARVSEINATENAKGHAAVLVAEIENLQGTHNVGRVTGAALDQAARTLVRQVQDEELPASMESEVAVYVSGNLANIYFDIHTGKVNQKELNDVHPGLLETLVSHEGIGLVVSYDESGDPWLLNKNGARHLRTAHIIDEDPLIPYGDPEFRAAQLLRLAEFPHAGDLIVISTLYPDGQVAAFEELVGCHGGLGGQQTDAFLFHPADMEVPPTSNASDVYHLLNARRDLPGQPIQPQKGSEKEPDSWNIGNLTAGMRDISGLLSRALRVLRLDRSVFHEVADDHKATGQALLIILLLGAGSGIVDAFNTLIPGSPPEKFLVDLVGSFIAWSLLIFLVLLAGRALKGQASFTRTFRTISFALVPEVITWLHFIPGIGPVFNIVGTLMVLVAIWIAIQEALRLSKWRALLIPLLSLVIAVLAIEIARMVIGGAVLTVDTILEQMGFIPG